MACHSCPTGWKSWIERDGRQWILPWSLSLNNSKFVLVGDLPSTDETYGKPLSFSQSLSALRNFAKSYGLLKNGPHGCTFSSYSQPSQKSPLIYPVQMHGTPTIADYKIPSRFDSLVELILQLVTISTFTFASFIRSAFYDDSIHSM